MLIGVISDTHIPKKAKVLPEIIFETFRGVNQIIHAGDIMSMEVLYKLEELAPVTAVAGNGDSPEMLEKLGDKKIITIGNFKFGLFHGHGEKGKTIERVIKCFEDDTVDCIIFGHSHIPYCQLYGEILLFNPGSPTDKRRNTDYSFGLIEIEETIRPRIVYFSAD